MLTVTPDFVAGYLKLAGSSDPDVLASRKHELVQKQQPLKLGSLAFIVIGAILTLSIIGTIPGLPMLIAAGWVQWKVRGNLKTIDAAYDAFLAGLPPARRAQAA